MIESIGFGTTQVDPGTFRVHLSPGAYLTVGLGVTATTAVELADATAAVWTNFGSPDPQSFRAVPMHEWIPTDGHQKAFQLALGPAPLGTFIATAFVELNGLRYWAPGYPRPGDPATQYGLQNRLVFRVHDPEVADLNIREVPIDKANARSDSTDISIIEDLQQPEPGWYSLQRLHDDGVNCVWFQVPYRLDPWDGRDPHDDAGSDYASNDWFSIDPDLSRDSRGVPPWDLDRAHRLANTAMKRLVDEAHNLGMKVLIGIAPNHVGHNFIYRDPVDGSSDLEVPRRDYRLSVVDQAQLTQVQQRLAGAEYTEELKNYAEYMLPQMYAAHYPDGRYNPYGANSVYEMYSPDWNGLWADVKHVNHGGHAGQHVWVASTPQNFHVLAYIGRAMAWAVTELGVDGFRIDHALGMPYHFFEQTLPWVEAQARVQRGPDAALIWVAEDHERKEYTRCVSDVIQSTGYRTVLEAFQQQDVDRIWAALAVVEQQQEFLATGNHDDERGVLTFGGDLIAYGNAIMSMELLGGPTLLLAGDEFGEAERLRFMSRGGIPTLWQLRQGLLPDGNRKLGWWVGRSALLRQSHSALRGVRRERLFPITLAEQAILAWSRPGLTSSDPPVLLVNNLESDTWVEATVDLGSAGRAWLEPLADEFFQIRDLVGFDPNRYLWSRPISGREILTSGLGIGLQPKQIQALELTVVR